MTRAEIITRITDLLPTITGMQPSDIATDKPLMGQSYGAATIDSLDVMELELALEDEFELSIGALDRLPADWSIDGIADAILAAGGGK